MTVHWSHFLGDSFFLLLSVLWIQCCTEFFGPFSIIMVILRLAPVLPLILGLGGSISAGGVSEGGVSPGGVRSSSESITGLIARGIAAAFEGCTINFRGLGGSSSISQSLFCSAGSKVNIAGLVFSPWWHTVDSLNLPSSAMNTRPERMSIAQYYVAVCE